MGLSIHNCISLWREPEVAGITEIETNGSAAKRWVCIVEEVSAVVQVKNTDANFRSFPLLQTWIKYIYDLTEISNQKQMLNENLGYRVAGTVVENENNTQAFSFGAGGMRANTRPFSVAMWFVEYWHQGKVNVQIL